jgi:hypothetical protein
MSERKPRGPNMLALLEETRPGHCVACDRGPLLPRGPRQRLVCGTPECEQVYQDAYQADRRLCLGMRPGMQGRRREVRP